MRPTLIELHSALLEKHEPLVFPFWQEGKLACVGKLPDGAALALDKGDFQGKEGETLLLMEGKRRCLLLGLGPRNSVTSEGMRRAAAAAVRRARGKRWKSLSFLLPTDAKEGELFRALLEGLYFSNYSYDPFKKSERSALVEKFHLIGGGRRAKDELKRTSTLMETVAYVRDLVNANADEITSDRLVSEAKKLKGVRVRVLRRKELEKEGMNLLLAVNQASLKEPALILLEYMPMKGKKDVTALVGKGITYDTGGLLVKTAPGGMETMRADMAAAAAVLGTVKAASELRLKRNHLGALSVAENAIGPASFRPGDCFRSHSGKGVEIIDTDAEGRLVLADAISYVQTHYDLTRMIDMATLTGSMVVALGEHIAGLFSNNEALAKGLLKASERTFERLHRMPLVDDYRDFLRSERADLRNLGSKGRKGGAIVAALFLQAFVHEKISWAHLDIAGPAFFDDPKGFQYYTTSATGFGVRLLIDFLENDSIRR